MSIAMSSWLRNIFHRPSTQAPAQTAFGGDSQEPVVVYAAANTMEADLVIALLASENIPAFASGAALGQVYGLQLGPMAEVNITVASSFADRARQIIEERHLGPQQASEEDESEIDGADAAEDDEFSSNS
jgi:hypothetical protein